MKQKQAKIQSQAGFTLIELLAVLAIMTLIMGALAIDFASQRTKRNIVLAKNETVTNLRKAQSYTLSSRDISAGVPAKYYVVNFTTNSTSYTIDSIDNNYSYHSAVETINLPTNIKVSSIQSNGSTYTCMQIVFSAPFGKIYAYGSSTCGSAIATVLRDPIQTSALSEASSKIYFTDLSGVGPGSPYVEVVPITGQMATY
ncbi:MAG TPA: type II secretion system protein [Patescibacteria group bacterium]|jgi:prepilin-type N-terminal cleavage/methylation domain-containing protein|nr:type II secretion system protein [Patescibacteria group bacterium]